MKYIIDIEKEPYLQESDPFFDSGLYRASNFKSLVFDQNGLAKLTPYTEPDRKAIEDDVWEFVRTVTDMTETQRKECFGGVTCDLDDYLTFQEAKSKYEEWLKQKDNELHIGDEVTLTNGRTTSVVIGFYYGSANLLYENGDIGQYPKNGCQKTGRHFPEVAQLFEKMRGDSDETD